MVAIGQTEEGTRMGTYQKDGNKGGSGTPIKDEGNKDGQSR